MKDTHCSHCGWFFTTAAYPKTCANCGTIAWGEPTPVVILLQPVYDPLLGRVGLAMARRAIEPHIGHWAFMGGHVNRGESLEDAALREWDEETGLAPRGLRFLRSYATPGNQVLAVFVLPEITMLEYANASLCSENSEFGILWRHDDKAKLCFPLHRDMAIKWFGDE